MLISCKWFLFKTLPTPCDRKTYSVLWMLKIYSVYFVVVTSLFVYTMLLYTLLTTLLYIKFYLGMDNFGDDTVLTKKSCCSSQNHFVPTTIFSYYIKTILSDAESQEEQDGSKQKFNL